MNKRFILTVGSASLLISASAAMAAAPGGGGFGQYTAAAGIVTDTMTGTTAASQTLVSGNGFLQQKVTTAEGTFYRTVILDNGVTATDAAAVQGLGFRNETFTGVTSNSGNLASEGVVAFAAPLGTATAGAGNTVGTVTASTTLAGTSIRNNTGVAILARGALATTGTTADIKAGLADPTGIKLLQNNDFGYDTDAAGTQTTEITAKSGAMQVNFQFLSNGEAANQEDRDSYLRLDEGRFAGTDTPGDITVRRSNGAFTAGGGTLTLPDGQTLAYAAGDDISVSLVDTGSLGGGTFGFPTTGTGVGNSGSVNANIQAQSFRNYTTNEVIEYVNDTYREVATNAGVIGGAITGYPQLLFSPQSTATAPVAWNAANWDSNFGAAPVVTVTNSTNQSADISPTSMTQAFPN